MVEKLYIKKGDPVSGRLEKKYDFGCWITASPSEFHILSRLLLIAKAILRLGSMLKMFVHGGGMWC